MKKLIIASVLAVSIIATAYAQFNAGSAFSAPAPQVYTTNVTTSSDGRAFLLLTNRAEIINFQLSGSLNSQVTLYDNNSTANGFTNSVNAAYNSMSSSNITYVTSFVGYNGFTNYYTNVGLWSFTVTNAAATNALAPAAAFAVAANTVGTYPCDIFCERGVVVQATTNVTLTFYYRTGR